jgi:cell division protein FtsW
MKPYDKLSYDKWVVVIVAFLILTGLAAVYSSTSVISPDLAERYQSRGIAVSQFDFVKNQMFAVLIGIIALLVAFRINLKHLKKMAVPLLLISLVCLLLVFTSLGVSGGGARRWINVWPSTFQPSELAKLSMVIFLAWYMSIPGYQKDRFLHFAIPVAIMGVFQVILIKQPDFGAVMSLAFLTLSMLFIAGVKLRYIFSLSLIGIPVIVKLILEPYRWERIVAFLDPWKDPLGSGYQLVQSFIAFGSGGITGVGLGEGRQKLSFLPEVHTDFIFAMVGEELGFLGASVIVFLFFVLFIRGLLIAGKSGDSFNYYLAYGISLMIAVQAVINFAVVTGMVPTKGLPLPFISYGGSALIVNMMGIGLLLNISRNARVLPPESRPNTWPEVRNNTLEDGSRTLAGSGHGKKFNTDNSVRINPQDDASGSIKWSKGYGYRRYGKVKFRGRK